MPPTQEQVDQYLGELRSKAQEATTTFGADSSETTKHRDGRVTVTLYFSPDDTTPAAIRVSEDAATAAAEQLRELGADTQAHLSGEVARVIGVFSAP